MSARRLIRKMRGGAQAHLIEASDGHYYVVKFRNNPQGRRVLVNEWLGATMLRFLGIACPEAAIVDIDPDFIGGTPELYMQLGNRRIPPDPGWHFGSRFPGHPDRVAVYDFVPDTLLAKVENLHEFVGTLAFDKWAGNADARQSVFLRARVRDYAPGLQSHRLRMGFVALMIDHGYLFNGPHWEFVDTPQTGMYFRPSVYSNVKSWDAFQPVLDRILHFPEDVIDSALSSLPPEWVCEDHSALTGLLERLLERRRRVPDLLLGCARMPSCPFPEWSPAEHP